MKKTNLRRVLFCSALVLTTTLTACTADAATNTTDLAVATQTESSEEADSFFTEDTVHSINIDVDESELDSLIAAYQADGSKEWIQVSVTIDGTTFENVGLKLKGNSTLRTLTNQSADEITAAELPWVIRLDKYEDGQEYLGRSRFVVRGNSTESSMNEALALAMLNEAGVAAEESAFTRFSVNDSEETLRLVVDVPDDDRWTEAHFGTNGLLYKAESEGDYSYRGTEASAYEEAFEQKYGKEDLTPLINFLDFINNASDEEFAENLESYLDVDAFASYLALQDLVANEDDIDGPGNNSYLYYDSETEKMTVVAWDQNLSFGSMGGGQGGGAVAPGNAPDGNGGDDFDPGNAEFGGELPEDFDPENFDEENRPDMPFDRSNDENSEEGKTRMTPPNANEQGSSDPTDGENQARTMPSKMGGNNILTSRFLENDTFSDLVAEKTVTYSEALLDSNFANNLLESYQQLLSTQATDLIDAETLTKETNTIATYLAQDSTDTTE